MYVAGLFILIALFNMLLKHLKQQVTQGSVYDEAPYAITPGMIRKAQTCDSRPNEDYTTAMQAVTISMTKYTSIIQRGQYVQKIKIFSFKVIFHRKC